MALPLRQAQVEPVDSPVGVAVVVAQERPETVGMAVLEDKDLFGL